MLEVTRKRETAAYLACFVTSIHLYNMQCIYMNHFVHDTFLFTTDVMYFYHQAFIYTHVCRCSRSKSCI